MENILTISLCIWFFVATARYMGWYFGHIQRYAKAKAPLSNNYPSSRSVILSAANSQSLQKKPVVTRSPSIISFKPKRRSITKINVDILKACILLLEKHTYVYKH